MDENKSSQKPTQEECRMLKAPFSCYLKIMYISFFLSSIDSIEEKNKCVFEN